MQRSALHAAPLRAAAVMLLTALTPVGAAFAADAPRVALETSEGRIVIELAPAEAPATVDNFLRYVRDGYYDGTLFHRVIDGFMIQGGGFDVDFRSKGTRDPIRNEADSGLKNVRGTVAMARTSDPHSATSQFFINVADNDFLDHTSPDARGWGYAVFGQVVEGMDVVDTIEKVSTGRRGRYQDVPLEPVVLQSATVVEAP